jgi:hypothetical protein
MHSLVHLVAGYFATVFLFLMFSVWVETLGARWLIADAASTALSKLDLRLGCFLSLVTMLNNGLYWAGLAFALWVIFIDGMRVPYARSLLLATFGLTWGFRRLIDTFVRTVFPLDETTVLGGEPEEAPQP